VTEALDYVPGRFKVIQHVRAAFSCRACETVVQAPAPYHPISRGRRVPGCLRILSSPSSTTCTASSRLRPGGRGARDLNLIRLGWSHNSRPGAAGREVAARCDGIRGSAWR
jgi:hypothetical protein